MFRRRPEAQPAPPEWEQRIRAARDLIDAQSPPAWLAARLEVFRTTVATSVGDLERLRSGLARLDPDRAGRELKDALRRPRPLPEHDRLVESLRQRYDSINRLKNRVDELEAAIERALADLDALAARSVGMGGRDGAWRLDETARLLDDDLTALEQAHVELADL